MDGRAVIKAFGGYLLQGALGAFGWRHGVPRCLGLLVFIGEEQRAPSFDHMPLDVVGEHGEEDVGADAALQAMSDGPDHQVNTFETAEGPFDI